MKISTSQALYVFASLICISLLISTGSAQDGAPLGVRPPAPSTPRYSLHNLTRVKLDAGDDGPRFICMVERHVDEVQKVRSTIMEIRQIVRNVRVEVDGEEKDVEKTVTVAVPVTTEFEMSVKAPRGKKPRLIDWDKARLCRLDGTVLTLDEAKEALPTLRTVLLAKGLETPLQPADKDTVSILSPDALVFITDELRDNVKPQFKEVEEAVFGDFK